MMIASDIVTRKRSHLAAMSADTSDDEDTNNRREREETRAGKWSAAEEHLAYQLISDFENGSLVDCEEGNTLRSYLARRLNCAPMRISKKFAGRCIGKVLTYATEDFLLPPLANLHLVSSPSSLLSHSHTHIGISSASFHSSAAMEQCRCPWVRAP
jgi:hypothetical protein